MNTKKLTVRFALLALLVAGSLYALASYGLRQGIDLRGGHSLIFEIRSSEAEIASLEAQQSELEEQLAKAEPQEEKDKLQERIDRIASDLKSVRRGGEAGDLAERMIAILKKRVDPNGMMALEWTPLGNNRIEIRMPAASEESETYRAEYRKALDELIAANLQRAEVRSLLESPADQRQERLRSLVGDDAAMQERFEQLAAAQEELTAAEKARDEARSALDKARSDKQNSKIEGLEKALAEAEGRHENALVRYEERLTELEGGNISPQRVATILGHYVSPAEERALDNPKEVARRREVYKQELDSLRSEHPSRGEQVNRVAGAYEAWANVRKHLDDPSDLRRLIAKAGVLEFRVAPYQPGATDEFALSQAEVETYVESLRTEGPEALRRRGDRFQWFAIRDEEGGYRSLVTADYAGQKYVLLSNEPGYSMLREVGTGGWSLARTYLTSDQTNRPAVGFEFDERGAKRFAALTSGNHGRCMAILLDDEVYSAPVIRATISKSGIIEMATADPREVNELIRTLEAGSLPARLNSEPVSVSSFGPSIGAVNRDMGLRAAKWGLVCVAVFMLLYYLLAGAIADVALVLNIVLVLGAMSMFSAVFTLPGIAGIILTMGMAVDANVLIFERLREEQAKGQSISMAIKNAYERAFSAIFDSNLTTLLTCAILGWFGTEEVRGFAITLGLGVLFSMFTALVVTRWVFQLLLNMGLLKKHVTMLRLIGVPRIDWMSKRYWFWGLSAAFIVLGIVSVALQGKNIFGIEFSAGTQAELTFHDDAMINGKLPDDATVRDMFNAKAGELRFDRLQATARVETKLNPNRVDEFLRDYDAPDPDGHVTMEEWQARKMDPTFFQAVDTDKDGVLSRDELQANLPPLEFQVSTTETQVSRIVETGRQAFGNLLEERVKHDFKRAADERVDAMGITVPAEGRVRLTVEVRGQINPAYREDLLDFEGGSLFIVRDVQPSLSKTELVQRIAEMREQPDFKDQSVSPTEVIGLTPAEDDTFTSFAIVVRPAEQSVVDRPGAWDEFAGGEWELIRAALEREEAINVRSFDAQVAGEAAWRAGFAVVFSWLAIVIYLWLRFGNWRWGLAAVLCLIHDVIIVIGLVAASAWLQNTAIGRILGIQSFKVDLAMVAAVLTVIGYSVNDTIVVFDRIRENRGKLTTISQTVINTSINQTLSRTLLTSGTTFIVVFIMYVMGGTGMHAFNYALLAGILFGTYSSVAVASPLLMGFRKALMTRAAAIEE